MVMAAPFRKWISEFCPASCVILPALSDLIIASADAEIKQKQGKIWSYFALSNADEMLTDAGIHPYMDLS